MSQQSTVNSQQIAIKVDNVSKTFKLPHEKHTSIKGLFVNILRGNKTYEKQKVLKDISFEVKKGEFFGIVGRNGSGKSTLLKLMAGIYSPDEGHIQVNGKLTPFIELGVGFNPELTGRENVFLNGALLGFNRKEMSEMYEEIVEFAELEKFMDQKLKNYSSGMQVRLAFAIAIQANSDVLLLDEVLAVGDASFQKKCFDYFRELKKQKLTVVYISHDMNSVREYCDRTILIDRGEIMYQGSSEEVAQKYTKMFMEKPGRYDVNLSEKRWGSGIVRAAEVNIQAKERVVVIAVKYAINSDVMSPLFGVTINSPVGTKVFETNTKWKKISTGNYQKGQAVKVTWKIPNIFTNGINYITVAVADREGLAFYDCWEDAASFRIDKDMVTTALTMPEYEVILDVR